MMYCYRGFLGFCWGALCFLLWLGLFFFLVFFAFSIFAICVLLYTPCMLRGAYIFYKISLLKS